MHFKNRGEVYSQLQTIAFNIFFQFLCVLQEVILQRKSGEEKLGLTLCYEAHASDEDTMTDVYVSEVSTPSTGTPNKYTLYLGKVHNDTMSPSNSNKYTMAISMKEVNPVPVVGTPSTSGKHAWYL